jgi:hypothetical protein
MLSTAPRLPLLLACIALLGLLGLTMKPQRLGSSDAAAADDWCPAIWRRTQKANLAKMGLTSAQDFYDRSSTTRSDINEFWPPECTMSTTAGAGTPAVAAADNFCGCVSSPADLDPAYTISDGHWGCKPGPNDLHPIFSQVAWCYVANGVQCPASFKGGDPNAPAMRQCAGFAEDSGGEVIQPNDDCQGEHCALPTARELLTAWAGNRGAHGPVLKGKLAPLLRNIETDGVATGSGPFGHRIGKWTILLPEDAAFDYIPAESATSDGYFYAGELFEGTMWTTLDGGTVRTQVPSCTTNDVSFPEGEGNELSNFVLSCNCHGDCLSNIIYGEGHRKRDSNSQSPAACALLAAAPCARQEIDGSHLAAGVRFHYAHPDRFQDRVTGRLKYWFITREAIILVHE